MTRTYILPCAGYDRPGGKISRAAAEKISSDHNDVVIGSMGALFKERPGEMRDYRTSVVLCLDGCGTNCASELARSRGRDDIVSVSIPDAVGSIEDFDETIQQLVRVVDDELIRLERNDHKGSPNINEGQSHPIEYLEEKFDKFTIRVAKGMKYSDNDFWVRVEGENVRIGVSDFLQQMMSDVYYVELAGVGTHVAMFDDAGMMESTKVLVEIIVPVSGTIIESNVSLEDSPEKINESPYDKGWLYLLRPDDLTELELLRDAADYLAYVLAKGKEEIGKKVD
ncbi:MAG: glycine cleavage system protein H [Candidatus Thorarchaeota archaeon]